VDPKKQRAQDLLRKSRLLPLVEASRQVVNVASQWPANRRFKRTHPDFPVPPHKIAFDAHGTVNWEFFRKSGEDRAKDIAGFVSRHVKVEQPAVLEWGCGPARVLRHMPGLLPPGSTFAGSDYNAKTIAWCQANLPGIRFQRNGLEPPLPFGPLEFDFVYAMSVLTHLSEPMQYEWIAELERVTRPGGVIVVTVKGESFRSIILPHELPVWDSGNLVVRGGVEEGKRMYGAFHPERFMREKLLAGREILEHVPATSAHALQDFWVFRPRAG
jgi:SAM-dependent methyltransferase